MTDDLNIRQLIEDADFALDDDNWADDGSHVDEEGNVEVGEEEDDDAEFDESDSEDLEGYPDTDSGIDEPEEEEEIEEESDQEEAEEDEEPEQAFDPPQFWSAQEKQIFAKAPKDVQLAILRNEQQRNAWANGVAQEASEAKRRYSALDNVLEDIRPELNRYGLDDASAVRKLFGWHQVMEKDPLVGVIELAKTYGLTREDIIGATDVGAYPTHDPRYEQLKEQFESLQSELSARDQATQTSQLEAEVDAFATATDQNGQPLRPYFNTLAPQIAIVVEELKAANPYWTNAQVLESAYSAVVNEFEKRFIKPRVESDSKAFQQRRAKRIKQVTAPLASSRHSDVEEKAPTPANTREALEMAARQLGLE